MEKARKLEVVASPRQDLEISEHDHGIDNDLRVLKIVLDIQILFAHTHITQAD